jgi:hypothetical protein
VSSQENPQPVSHHTIEISGMIGHTEDDRFILNQDAALAAVTIQYAVNCHRVGGIEMLHHFPDVRRFTKGQIDPQFPPSIWEMVCPLCQTPVRLIQIARHCPAPLSPVGNVKCP